MAETTTATTTNTNTLSDRGTWTRLLYMILFAVIFNIAELVILVIVVVQFLFKLFTGKINDELRRLGDTLGAYLHEIVAYLTYHREERPYPFGPWPEPSRGAAATPVKPARRSRKPKAKPGAEPSAPYAGDAKA